MAPTTLLPTDSVAADLAAWIAQRDRAALERALEQAATWAQPQARRLLGHASDADDAVQEALVQVVRSAHRYDPQRPFRPWLARIVHDACARLLRARSRRRHHEDQAPPPAPGDDPNDPETEAAVREVVLDLPESLRAAVDLHYFADLSQAEAAQALGISENACAVRLNRARNRLRDLLLRRGLNVGAVAALTAIASQASAATAPASIAASIAAQAAGGILPATTIPLSLGQKIGALVSAHPLASAGIACALGVLAISPLFTAEPASEAPPTVVAPTPSQTPPPPVVASPVRSTDTWIGESAALLPYLDTQAPYSFAADIAALRARSASTKPLSLLHETEVQTWFARIEDTDATQAQAQAKPVLLTVIKALITEGSGIAFSLRDTSQGTRFEERLLTVIDLGPQVQEVSAALSGMAEATVGDIGPFSGIGQEDGILFYGFDARRLVIAAQPWLRSQIQSGGQSPVLTSPIHLRVDAGPLVERYAERSGPDADPAQVAAVLGPEWRRLRPLIRGSLRILEDTLRSDLTISGARTFSPLLPVALILGNTTTLPMGSYAAAQMRAPGITIPEQIDTLLRMHAGFDLAGAIDPAQLPNSPLRHALLAVHGWWDGDVALTIRSGTPLPQAGIAFGIRPGQDPAAALNTLATALGAGIAAQPESGFIDKAATLPSPMGLITLRAAADRVVILVNSEASTWPGIAEALAEVNAAPCQVEADLAAILRTAWPFILMAIPAQERQHLPKAEILARNLPPWRMTWSATPDGCRIEESGLPLVSLLVGLAALRTIAEADPVREIEIAPRPANLSDF